MFQISDENKLLHDIAEENSQQKRLISPAQLHVMFGSKPTNHQNAEPLSKLLLKE